jgi:hypothetical protein
MARPPETNDDQIAPTRLRDGTEVQVQAIDGDSVLPLPAIGIRGDGGMNI